MAVSTDVKRGEAGIALPLAAVVAGAAAMGGSPILVRLAEVGPFASAFWRVALALPALYLWMRMEDGAAAPMRVSRAVLFAGLAFAGDLFFWHLAIRDTTVANATFFATTAPLWVVAFGWLLFARKPSVGTLVGLALCLAGGFALVSQSFEISLGRARGDAFGLATAVFFGLYILAVGQARASAGPGRIIFQSSVITAALLLPVALVLDGRMAPPHVGGAAALVALALVSHVGGQGLLAFALGRLAATFSSFVIFIEAIVAAALGWLVLGEALTIAQLLGGVAILAGIVAARPRGG
ncbi:MAG: DMT family transporter [Hyphomicrobiales bacterium]|nr:DMT family transporter [Hyphomicrobiales bacterium]MDE2017134.1 DMT family transporter [Hyphomicrobiales bacterium]